MTAKGYRVGFLLLTCVVVGISYHANQPIFPIRNETKKSLGYIKESFLNFTELSAQHGYPSEEHSVTTEDGYVLKMFRIRKGKNCEGPVKKPPVILMHGLLQSSDVWLDAGPDAGLAYLLSDACYDLWTGNQRGNYYTRTHKTLNPDTDAKFWEFSVDEIGYYDIPAMIDYVIKHTGSKKVNYIGYSQGSGTFYAMCSERPGSCDKVSVQIGLAPASRQTHTKSVSYKAMCTVIEKLRGVLATAGVYEVLSKGYLSQAFMEYLCQWPMMSNSLCYTVNAIADAYHPGSITNQTNQILFSHFPAGTSSQNIARYAQSFRTPYFEKFDYGKEKNLELYGSERPPQYNLSAVTVPVVIIYGKNDHLVDPKDVHWLRRQLPNVLETVEVKDPLWNHMDVSYSQYTNELIFPKINEYLMEYSFT
ncbi:alpha/beta-hydrolase lipase region domain-containing protein [Phthorimaea operculella]|nr:alpha/beta-hydrolase lipase region domain-containing protein [Phthorimaea operculella]